VILASPVVAPIESRKKWAVLPRIPDDALAEIGTGLHPLIAHLCYHREMRTRDEIDRYFRTPVAESDDRFRLPDMRAAVDRIERAVKCGEMIGIHGDYDADGVCSTALLVEFLSTLGVKPVVVIPSRFYGGYGLHCDALDQLRASGVTLLLTVDCGISNKTEVAYAATLGMDVVITDHHAVPPDLPNALAVVNAARTAGGHPDDRCLAGVGVAYRLAEALSTRFPGSAAALPALLDLVALATIADMAPLRGQNRHLVQLGLERIRSNPRPGLKALMVKAGILQQNLTAENISFALAPRINAAGRMGDAMVAYDLLMAKSSADAEPHAETLQMQNRKRQDNLHMVHQEALDQARQSPRTAPCIVVASEGWSPGLIGLVASRLVEEYYRPTLVFTLDGDCYRGSARSIPGFDITKALGACGHLLHEFGGHAMAAGCTVARNNLDALRSDLLAHATPLLSAETLVPTLRVDAPIKIETLHDPAVRDALRQMRPFGAGNCEPLFVLRRVETRNARTVGKDHRGAKFTVANGVNMPAIAFGFGDLVPTITRRRWVDLAFHLQNDSFPGVDGGMQLFVKDVRVL